MDKPPTLRPTLDSHDLRVGATEVREKGFTASIFARKVVDAFG